MRRLALILGAFGGLALAGLVLGYFYLVSRDALLADAARNLNVVAGEAAEDAARLFQPSRAAIEQLLDARLQDRDFAELERSFFATASFPVRDTLQISGMYVGLADGSFLLTQKLLPTDLIAVGALSSDYKGLVRRVLNRGGSANDDAWLYREASGAWVRAPVKPTAYDPRQRPWFRKAVEQNALVWSEPYIFSSSNELGITLAAPVYRRDDTLWGVIGVDIAVSSLSEIILDYRERRIGRNGFLFIGDEAGHLIGHSRLLSAIEEMRRDLGPSIEAATNIRDVHRENGDDLVLFNAIYQSGFIYRADNNGRQILGIRLPLAANLNLPMFVYVGEPVDDIVGGALSRLQQNIVILALLLVVILVVAIYAAKLRNEVATRKRTEAALALARDAAEEATRAKSAFLAMMSHEIRTPMNGVMSMAEMLDQTDLTDDQRGMSSVIRGSAGALLTIINDILDFSKIEAGKLDIEKMPFSLLEAVEGAGELVSGRTDEKGIGLVIDLDPTLPERIEGDPTRLRQILLNLMGNAVKFTEHGEVVLRVFASDTSAESVRIRFEVVDTGIGLTPEQQGRLFKAFAQADTSTSRKYGGTGLGLSISQRLCEIMGGTIGVVSAAGQGSTFWFELPFTVIDRSQDKPAIAIADAQVAAIGFSGTERAALARLLSAAGIVDPLWGDVVADAGARPIVLLRATSLETADAIRPDRQVILLAPRALASTLAAAKQGRFFATLTLPVRRRRLWHVLAAALGRVELGQRQTAEVTDAIGWTPPTVDEARSAGALILVAEDNHTNQTVIRRLLNQRGYAHEIANNGVEALKFLQRGGYGLLLTDFHMPEMDGFQLTAEIRRREKDGGNHLPVVALTADALPGTEKRCLDAGMDGYLTKPIDSAALTDALERIVPQALPLRTRGGPLAKPAGTPAADPAIIDLRQLSEIFGGLNDDAWSFMAGLVNDLPRMIGEIAEALKIRDRDAARDAAHALKGASRSSGLPRLGQIAADMQDRLDDGDVDAAAALLANLMPAYQELRATLEQLQPATTA